MCFYLIVLSEFFIIHVLLLVNLYVLMERSNTVILFLNFFSEN